MRTVSAMKSNSWFLGGWTHFVTVAYANSITPTRHCSMISLKRYFTSSKVNNLPFCSTSSSHFCTIVAVEEGEVGRRHVPIIDFRQFPEWEARNNDSCGNSYIRRRDTEVCMVFEYHLGGLLASIGGHVGYSSMMLVNENESHCLAETRKSRVPYRWLVKR